MLSTNNIKKTLTTSLLLICLTAFGQANKFKVTLDAGHGGKDSGASYHGYVEKNIALSVVLKVGAILEKVPDFDVNYTRTTDVFIDLVERANIANRANANIFVSIHCNANRNTEAYGTETYVMGMTKVASNLEAARKENSVITLEKDYKQKYEGFDPNSPETMIGMTLMQEEYLDNSISLASKVQQQFALIGKKVRHGGVKQAPYMVLHKAYMPRILIEMGFVSNPTEGAALDSESGQDELAKAIARAIISYKKEYYGGEDFNIDFIKIPQNLVKRMPKDTTTVAVPKIIPEIVKEKESTIKTTTNENKKAENNITDKVVFIVQLSVSDRAKEASAANFNGLENVSVVFENNLYKFQYGATSDYNTAKGNLIVAKSKGFKSAFLVAYKNGVKYNNIKEALQQ
jgi:N-acetylmuramoyl-L-alanine amidase